MADSLFCRRDISNIHQYLCLSLLTTIHISKGKYKSNLPRYADRKFLEHKQHKTMICYLLQEMNL